MKKTRKFFTMAKTVRLVIILALFVSAISVSAVAAAVILKQSDPIPQGDYYGAYFDSSKVQDRGKTVVSNSERIFLKYVRTENLKELPVSKRVDSYGTYDVYVDENQTEYLYLYNSDVCCGYKMNIVGIATLQADAIEKSKALEIANEFLRETRVNYNEYQLASCVYDELAGYYDIQYYLPIDGYKSDDIFRVWVDATGKVTSFSEFNYKRYDNIKVRAEKYAKADQKLAGVVTKNTENSNFTIVDEYISINDSGDVILIKVVDLKIPNGDNYFTKRELYSQPIE